MRTLAGKSILLITERVMFTHCELSCHDFQGRADVLLCLCQTNCIHLDVRKDYEVMSPLS